jgi:aldose 1-epimerase
MKLFSSNYLPLDST